MKKIFTLTIWILLLSVVSCSAASNVKFIWDASPDSDLAGYRLYQSTVSGEYDKSKVVAVIPANLTTTTLENVQDGKYFWVATAFDTSGNESEYSNEVTATLDTTAPKAPVLTINNVLKINLK